MKPASPLGPPGPVPFELGGVIGRGAMVEVRSAHDPRLDRELAVKMVTPGDQASAARLAREATLTARLEHPGVVPVFAAGTAPDGRAWYAMRLLPGRSLDAAIADSADATARLGLVRHVMSTAEAVAYAHGEGILHRDLKPANILIGTFGETVVGDWGLACTLEEATRADGPAGTPGYMSPEQAAGAALDVRADVYALGATLAQVVTGAPPDAATPLRLARAQRVAPELVAIAERALRPDPNDRYPTARAFADDLLAWFEGRRVSAHQYSTAEVMARYFARWRIPLAVGMLGLAAVSVATTYGWWQTDGARRQALASEAAALKARADEVQAFATALRTQAGNAAAAGFDMEAELLAAHALKRLEHPDTRGVLAAVSGRPRWTLVASHAAPNCQRRSISPDGSALLCFDDKAARLVDLRTGAEERREGAWNRGTFAGAPDQLVLVDESMVAYAWQAGSAPVAVDGETARWSVFPASLTAGQTLIQTNKAALRIDVLKGTATPTAPCGASHTQRATLDYRGLELTVCDDLRVLAQQPDGSVTTLHRFPTAEGVPSFVAAFADGRTFAGTLQGYAVVVSRAGEVLNHARLGADAIFAASLTPHRAAIGLSGGDVVIWDLAANTVTTRIRGRDIATAWLDDETLRFSGARIEDIRAPLDTHPHRITLDSGVAAVTFSPDGSRMAATTGSGSVTVIEVSTGRRVAAFRSETAVAKDAAFSPDGQRLAVASAGKIQRVYDLATGEETDVRVAEAWRRILWFREAGILGSPYATRLRWAGNGLDAEPEALPDPPGLEDAESCSAGGHAVGLASNGELWWADDGSRPAWRRLAQPEKPMAAACNAASAIVISDQEVRRYALDGTVSWRAAVPGTGIDVAITPDDRWVAVGTMDGSVHVWRVGEAKPRVRLLGHRARAAAVAFSPDSRWLATGAWDDDVRQWAVSAFEADATATASEVEAALGSRLDEVMGTMFTVP